MIVLTSICLSVFMLIILFSQKSKKIEQFGNRFHEFEADLVYSVFIFNLIFLKSYIY